MQAAFFKLSGVLPIDEAVEYMKEAIAKSYSKKGEQILNMNRAAVDRGLVGIQKIEVPAAWADLEAETEEPDPTLPEYVGTVMRMVNAQKGDQLPVSVWKDRADGTLPLGTSKYEKRGFAAFVPQWGQY